ncbi:MAG: hypothetical protein H6Q89_1712 [Myxococcaceae bacterium]|nr:hypothetical protein [Myxococcaceae bacterium]
MTKKLSMPATISVVVFGAAVTGCGTPTPQVDAGVPDGGLCPPGCFSPQEADGGPLRTEDGGVECFC